jgi:hypothetical protein
MKLEAFTPSGCHYVFPPGHFKDSAVSLSISIMLLATGFFGLYPLSSKPLSSRFDSQHVLAISCDCTPGKLREAEGGSPGTSLGIIIQCGIRITDTIAMILLTT